MKRFLAVPFAALIAAAPALADLAPGEWQLTVNVKAGVTESPPISDTRCLKQGDPAALFGAGGVSSCTFTNKRDDGATFSFDVSCSGVVPASGTGTVRYTAQSLEGVLALRAEMGGGQGVDTTSRISGRRTGPCKAP